MQLNSIAAEFFLQTKMEQHEQAREGEKMQEIQEEEDESAYFSPQQGIVFFSEIFLGS